MKLLEAGLTVTLLGYEDDLGTYAKMNDFYLLDFLRQCKVRMGLERA